VFGVFLPQLRMSFATIEAKARSAEELGYHSVWLMDHLAAPTAPGHDTLEGWTLAAALAARTTTIRLGHLVTANPFRHPALLAKMAATVDVISGGRLELGLGWGSVEEELVAYGFGAAPPRVRAAQLGEAIEVIELMFAGEPFDFDGDHFQLKGATGRPRPLAGRVPVHVGGAGRRLTMPLVARHADWWNCPAYAVDRLDELRPLAGNARVSVQHPVGLAASTATRVAVQQLTEKRFGAWGGMVTGTPDEVVDALAREQRAGVELFILQFHDFATPETLSLFAREVMPAL
jgi:alkanesulfonate monooxygenase SsuD/methylene tetrahydromethanopterin reductase-like flavin-dependent oxidoreductase (luciferase family)